MKFIVGHCLYFLFCVAIADGRVRKTIFHVNIQHNIFDRDVRKIKDRSFLFFPRVTVFRMLTIGN